MAKSKPNEPTLEQIVNSLNRAVVYLMTDVSATRKTLSDGLKKIDNNFIEIHRKIDALSKDTGENFVDVDLNLQSIKTEISKINKATRYEQTIKDLEFMPGRNN